MSGSWYPAAAARIDEVQPVPRRLRATLGGRNVLDTTRALYVWEWKYYPRYYVPLADVDTELLHDEHHEEVTSRGMLRRFGLRVGDVTRPGAVQVYDGSVDDRLADTVRFDWDSLDAWYEEDEQVFVHARNPYVRVDALRSSRHVRVEREGVLLADSRAPVLLFETGLPTRYYLDRTDVDLALLTPSSTVTACPYKGVTSEYWSLRRDGGDVPDLAWSYHYPTAAVARIAGLVAFYNERVDLVVDGVRLERATPP